MKTLIGALLGTGALGLLLVAYLALTGRQEVREDVSIDKVNFEQEATRFDQTFEDKWQTFGGKQSAEARHKAKTEQYPAAEKPENTRPPNDKDLAEMKALLEAADRNR